MKTFTQRQQADAISFAINYGQALHLHRIIPARAPKIFKRYMEAAHLFDIDTARLVTTARALGVKKVFVHYAGYDRQHIDLCGAPLERARAKCLEE